LIASDAGSISHVADAASVGTDRQKTVPVSATATKAFFIGFHLSKSLAGCHWRASSLASARVFRRQKRSHWRLKAAASGTHDRAFLFQKQVVHNNENIPTSG